MTRLPALFIGHGSPMNAIEDSAFRRAWAELGRSLPRPKAVLCVSAHWETRGVFVTGLGSAAHDPRLLRVSTGALRRSLPGAGRARSRAACRVAAEYASAPASIPSAASTTAAWSVLVAMYPEADVPVVQLSLDSRQPGAFHYELARLLRPLRDEGVLILGSGNIVHNLRLVDFGRDSGYDWAIRFDALVRARIEAGEHEALAAFTGLGPDARLAIPTPEHYLPLLYALGAGQAGDRVRVFNAGAVLGSISMTSVVVGAGDLD